MNDGIARQLITLKQIMTWLYKEAHTLTGVPVL